MSEFIQDAHAREIADATRHVLRVAMRRRYSLEDWSVILNNIADFHIGSS